MVVPVEIIEEKVFLLHKLEIRYCVVINYNPHEVLYLVLT